MANDPSQTGSLAEIYKNEIGAANESWTESDKLYVTVCGVLVGLAALFGGASQATLLVGLLVALLSINWLVLIRRYRNKIGAALEGLGKHCVEEAVRKHYIDRKREFDGDWKDFIIAGLLLVASVLLMLYPWLSGFLERHGIARCASLLAR